MASRRNGGPLSATQLSEIAEASLQNASHLISQARVLLRVGSIAIAYSIGVVAGEEFGKCQLAIGSIGRSDGDAEYWKEWWRSFYGHGPKLVRSVYVASNLIPPHLITNFISILEPALREQRRERGFYVEVVDGRVELPSDTIGENEAVTLVNCFSLVIDGYVAKFEGRSLSEAFLEANAGSAVTMRLALETRDDEQIRNAWEATTGEKIDDEVLAQIMKMLD